jgi:hypothetical protein
LLAAALDVLCVLMCLLCLKILAYTNALLWLCLVCIFRRHIVR